MILLTTMAVLLPLLAALQYYWLGQVSRGASERLQSSLQADATRFRQDFNREFIRAYLTFQIDSSAPPADIERNHLERLESWKRSAPYPQLVSSVFVIDYDDHDRPRLNHVNDQAHHLESTEWTNEFGISRDRFEKRSGVGIPPLESFDETIPALIVPIPSLGTNDSQEDESPRPAGFTILKLDLNYLQSEFIPSLIKRGLFERSDEYNLAVVSIRQPERIIYSSGSPSTDFASSDVSTRIFGLEPDELQAFMRTEGVPGAGAGQKSTRLLRLNLRYLKGPSLVSSGSSTKEDGRWQLLIKHQAGSLAAAMNSVRRRNLAISFGILLLLATGILMTAISMKRAERLAQQQMNFVAGVTHELRTPLAVICSAGENLADGIVESPRKVTDYGEVIYREGRRLSAMVEQVLEFAGAQSEVRRYDLRPTKIADVIHEAIALCDAQIQERDFKVETVIDADLPPVKGDAAALKQVMQNLISNAIKYNGESRWVRISAQTCSMKQGIVRITVEDRGVGIGKSEIDHVFEPFFRGREALAAQIGGSGVGLSIVKQIVSAHGGQVTVKSAPGAGTVFTVDLPIANELTEIILCNANC